MTAATCDRLQATGLGLAWEYPVIRIQLIEHNPLAKQDADISVELVPNPLRRFLFCRCDIQLICRCVEIIRFEMKSFAESECCVIRKRQPNMRFL